MNSSVKVCFSSWILPVTWKEFLRGVFHFPLHVDCYQEIHSKIEQRKNYSLKTIWWGPPGCARVKTPPFNAEGTGSIPGWSGSSISGYIPKELKLGTQTDNSQVFHSQHYSQKSKVEANQISIDRWIDKQNVVWIYSGILFSLEENSDTWPATVWMTVGDYANDKRWHYVFHKRHYEIRQSQRQILYDSTYMMYIE